jgi:proline racemase
MTSIGTSSGTSGAPRPGRSIGPIRTVELHTGGEPVRIVVDGLPPVLGGTILEKRRYAREELDHIRRALMAEPRGHHDMYGVWFVEPDLDDADLAVLFTHNEGYSTMCGHATIALGRYAIEAGLVAPLPADDPRAPWTPVRIQAPCGLVEVRVEVRDGQVGEVRFTSVPAFSAALDLPVEVPEHGRVVLDVGYGGAFYAIVAADELGVELGVTPIATLVERATAVTDATAAALALEHPASADLAFLYGTIVTDRSDREAPEDSTNVCVFADRQVDRSPTGSGVTARTAVRHARGLIGIGDTRRFTSVTGATFTATVAVEHASGDFAPAGRASVEVEVGGRAHRTGTAEFVFEDDDPLRDGFLLR